MLLEWQEIWFVLGLRVRTFSQPLDHDIWMQSFYQHFKSRLAYHIRVVFVDAMSTRDFALSALIFRNVWYLLKTLFCGHLVSSGLQNSTFCVVVMKIHDVNKKLSYIREIFWFTKLFAEKTIWNEFDLISCLMRCLTKCLEFLAQFCYWTSRVAVIKLFTSSGHSQYLLHSDLSTLLLLCAVL